MFPPSLHALGFRVVPVVFGMLALLAVSPALGQDKKLNFVQEPPSSVVQGDTFSVHLEVDSMGTRILDHSPSINIALEPPTTATLSGTTSLKIDPDGVARFDGLSINEAGNYRIIATTGGQVQSDTSSTMQVTPSLQATHLEFYEPQQPTDTQAGATISPVQVRALNGFGLLDISFEGQVTLTIGTNPGGGTLSGTTTVSAVNGVATFSDLSINKAGNGYTLVASASGLDPDTSVAFDITPGPASGATSTITANPTSVPADASSTSTITVVVKDAFDNVRTQGGDNVLLSTTAGTLGSVTDHANGTYTAVLTAPSSPATATVTGTVNGTTIADDATVTFTPVATRLDFGQQPTNAAAGAAISPPVTVRAEDNSGSLDTSFTGNVTIAIGANPGGGTLSGTTTVAAVNGVATFSNLSINKAGNGYTLVASASGLDPGTSAAFNITPGPASGATSTITAAPTSIPADGASTSTITVVLRDAFNNPLTAGGDNIVLSTTAGTLGPVTDNANGTYTAVLTAPSIAATATVSGTVNGSPIADTATVTFTATTPGRLAFDQQPTDAQAGAAISPAVRVRAVNSSGTTDTSFTGNVTIAIGANPGGGTLSGTTTVAAVAGVATFGNLSINRAGSGYTLAASASGLTGATSNPFNITPGPASGATSTITANPTSIPADGSSTSAITVELRDAFGNPLTSGGDAVALSTTAGTLGPLTDLGNGRYNALLRSSTSPATATVSGTVNGAPIADTASVAFTAPSGVATRLGFFRQPTDTRAGATISPVEVRAVNDAGQTATSFTGNVTIAIGANPGGGTLSGTTTVPAVAGVAIFNSLSINRAGSGYTLVASASGLAGATSNPFAITPAAASGATSTITADPTSIAADGASTSTITIQVRDASGTLLSTGGDDVRLTTTAGTLGPVRDNNNGTYTATLTSSTTPATATISGTVNGQTISDDAIVTFTAAATDLAVTATVSDPTPTVGDTVVYSITVSNQGPLPATGVEVTDDLPDRLTYISSDASQGAYNPQSGVWTVGSLGSGESATLQITARVEE